MNFFDQDNSYNDFSYTNYPRAIPQNNDVYDYSATNNSTYYRTNIVKPIFNNRYGINNTNDTNFRTHDSNLDKALDMIRDAIMDELNDEAFYTTLINQAIMDSDKDIISDIRDDEMKHNKLLRELYYSLTGVSLPISNNTPNIEPMTYVENLQKALISETNGASKYMQILNAMPDKKSYQIILEILIDELRHANKYNLLISRAIHNITRNEEDINEKKDENV